MSVKTIPLSDGTTVPWVAFGTGTAFYNKDCTEGTVRAISVGFNHLDCAQVYGNEEHVGAAIASSGVARETLYITTKLGAVDDGKTVEDMLRISLGKLRTEYVDLFLVHMPAQHEKREGGIKQVWREMADVKSKGLAKSIGVSNFNTAQLKEIISLGLGKPVVNQIEYQVFLAKTLVPLLEYSREQGIVTASYGGLTPILPERVKDPVIASACTQIANTLDKLSAKRGEGVTRNQIMLKWLQGEGILAVTTSTKESRLKEYLTAENVPDLTPEEKKELEDATDGKHFRAFVRTIFHSVTKSLE
ncbi:hypothetical protein M0805_006768 [Coniferiporia weirii]|nr:hypothetical protein M0805_006768 [Coniferiporia weirii]